MAKSDDQKPELLLVTTQIDEASVVICPDKIFNKDLGGESLPPLGSSKISLNYPKSYSVEI